MTGDEFAQRFDVSRETLARLTAHCDLVLKWNRRINLVGRDSEPSIWWRHVADSAQLWRLRPTKLRHWADLGAGAGYPGLVIAALAAEAAPEMRVTLVESDVRKAVFLGEAARAMGLRPAILSERIESIASLDADVVSARALAPLDRLLDHLEKHRRAGGVGLFPKGDTVHKEIESATQNRRVEHRIHPSITAPGAAIVEVGAVSSV